MTPLSTTKNLPNQTQKFNAIALEKVYIPPEAQSLDSKEFSPKSPTSEEILNTGIETLNGSIPK